MQIFGPEAGRLQAGIAPSAPPPIGKVDDPQQRDAIYARGPLNGVAACYFIRGMIFQKRGDMASAREAFQAAEALPFARVIDPTSQVFWSPAQKSAEQRVLLP